VTQPTRPRLWLHSPALDVLVGCGAWSLPLLALTFLLQREHALVVAFAFYLLGIFCNNPHYMATIHRAYGTAADFKKYRFFTIYVTVLMLLTLVLVHFVPRLFPWVVTLYLTWSPWHYTGQNFGIAQMFIRRSGAPPDPAARQWLYFSYVASFGVWFLTLHSFVETDPYFLSLRIPENVATPLRVFFALAFLGCSFAAFIRLRTHLRGTALIAPLLLTLTQALWFVVPALLSRYQVLDLPASYFSAGALAFMHCAQYLWITSFYARRETPVTQTATKTPQVAGDRSGAFSFWRYYLALIVGGIALFVPGPWIASRVLGHDFVESFLIFMALVNVHHFILDGAIWKLRDGRIARLLLGRATPDAVDEAVESQPMRRHLGWLFGATRAARFTRLSFGVGIVVIGIADQAQYLFTQRDSAAASLEYAQSLNPKDTRVYFRRAQQALAKGDQATARKELKRIVAINPRNAPAQHLLGQIIFQSGDTAAALAHYDRMAEFFRPDLSIATNRGLLRLSTGDAAFAAERFNEALTIAPHKTGVHFLLAEALAATGDHNAAQRQYALFVSLFEENPGNPSERDADFPRYHAALLRLGGYAEKNADLAAAESRYQRAADVAATYRRFAEAAVALERVANVQEKQDRPGEALRSRAASRQAASLANP
jgi:tetratricopeptide (TPR) repeat protein